ncbi:MAG: Dihydrolipoyllysine-residue succinyltransferase component of 2-oxoglutarate dehydrogenase complex [Bacteroidia bacterium]|jgi:2-oxoglutarate dehydrogenase E2 component (dihydrolipoamide succinyltransferase)|nr:MAG: Dihydrolipoyllysine-residue succinyltransferase component of 2-oxoglutarate dehydrogenase complex [Bacteroidia bacterium]
MSVELKIPSVGESITQVTIASWLKEDGDYVEMDEAVAELESDKATVELNAEQSGILKIIVEEGEDVEIGAVVASIDTSAEPPAEKAAPAQKESTQAKEEPAPKTEVVEKNTSSSYATGTPSPAANKILVEKGISPQSVTGTGKDGRITKYDAILANVEDAGYGLSVEPSREQHREKMSNLRKTVARRLVSAKNETAMLTTFNEVNMQPIFDTRAKYKEKFREMHGVNLGFMSFFTRACALSLQKFPKVNAFIDGEEMVMNDFVDVSIAVSSPKGLMVPVMRNVENMTLWDIESEVKRLAIKARDGKLSIPEMTGGTFTITNGGVFGSMLSTPIINPPQSAILGMHNIVERPVVEKGNIVARPVMYVALSYDHRIIDGKESVGFLVSVKNYLENPETMLMGKDPMDLLMGL